MNKKSILSRIGSILCVVVLSMCVVACCGKKKKNRYTKNGKAKIVKNVKNTKAVKSHKN